MSGNRLTFSATLDDKVSKGLTLISKRFKETGTQASFLGNVGAKAVSQGFSLIDRALSGTIQFLGDASQAAAAEEVSIARLSSSLKANVPAWDGNTEAIEKTLKARMRLGFSDDEQRESLARLVGATRNVTEALDLQRTAMDLARFKNIDLMTASEALIKIEGGQFRALKGLIGSTEDITTATEAMAAVQRVASGAAEKLSNTQSGKLLNSQIKVGEAMERFGEKTLPLVVEGAEKVADAVENVATVFDLLNGKLPETEAGLDGISTTLNSLNPATWGASRALEEYERRSVAAAKEARDLAVDMTGNAAAARAMATQIQTAGGEVEKTVIRYAAKTRDANQDIVDSFQSMHDKFQTLGQATADAIYDPLIAKAELTATEAEIQRQRNLRNAAKAGSQERTDAQNNLNELNKKKIALLADLVSYGDKAAATALATEIATLKSVRNLTTAQRAQLALLEAALARARNAALGLNNALNSRPSGRAGTGYASGGYFPGGTVATVGEEGPEKLVAFPGGGGYIIPNAGGGGSKGKGGMRTIVVPLYINGREFARATAADMDDESYWRSAGAGGSSLGG